MGVVFKSRDRRVGFFQIAGSCLDVSGGASVRGVRAPQSAVGHAYSKNRSIFWGNGKGKLVLQTQASRLRIVSNN